MQKRLGVEDGKAAIIKYVNSFRPSQIAAQNILIQFVDLMIDVERVAKDFGEILKTLNHFQTRSRSKQNDKDEV